ncbi:MAG: amino acid carrier protein, partial [Planctomycetales bacterium]|nr:amino acid carrier protein [Planctomycetales bacterium]
MSRIITDSIHSLRVLSMAAIFVVVAAGVVRGQSETAPPSESEAAIGLDQKIDQTFKPIADTWGSIVFFTLPIPGLESVPFVVILLVMGAAFFTLAFGFANIRLLPLAVRVVRGKYDNLEKSGEDIPKHVEVFEVDGDLVDTIRDEAHGEVSHFQALATAVSGTVGLGNIAGVAVAVATGGPGATFWMIICGFLGMSTKFVECTLGVQYRDVDADGTVHGGPMYYLRKGMADRGMGGAGKVMGIVFAILCIGASFGGGNAFQSNQAAQQIKTLFGLPDTGAAGTMIGVVMAILVGFVIIGGIKRIASFTEKIVPLMAVVYCIAALIIILMNITHVPWAIKEIFTGAFTPAAGIGGILGVMIQGFQRAAFSNEAGTGSAAIAHSAVKTKYPASEGVVALLEPFIDTVVICT